MGFFDFMTEDIAIDLGTANTLIIHNGKVVIDSPSIVARNRIDWKNYCYWSRSQFNARKNA